MVVIDLSEQVNASPKCLLKLLTDHPNLSRFFNAEFSVVRTSFEGNIEGGAGCQRKVTSLGQTFVEEITKADEESIEYRIVGSKPLKHHQGIITFTSNEQGTLVNYYIEGISPSYIPTFIVQFLINRDIQKALKAISKHFQVTRAC